MIVGLSSIDLLDASLIVLGAMLLVGGGYALAKLHLERDDLETQVAKELAESDGEVTFEPPEVSLGPLDYIRAARHLQKQRKAAKKGWVKWYRIGSNFGRPKWVKPKLDGSGIMKYSEDGQPYYFEKDAMLTDQRTGAWVAVHRDGEADPINLADPAYPGIQADKMQRVINLEAEDKPPGLFDNLFGGMDSQTMMWLGIGLLFIVFAAYRYMGGAA